MQQAKRVWATDNPTIDKPREIALALLQPTQAQIERAWELHFSSVVFESYGFAPRFAVEGDAINQAVKDGMSRDEMEDLREGTMMNRGAANERERKEFLDAVFPGQLRRQTVGNQIAELAQERKAAARWLVCSALFHDLRCGRSTRRRPALRDSGQDCPEHASPK